MIYFSADDYGLCDCASLHIQQCIDKGAVNKVSVLPNLNTIDLRKISENKDVRASLHLNLVEGRCLSDASEIQLLADEEGNFRHTFGTLLKLSIFQKKKLEAQAYKEIKAQVLFWKSILPENAPFFIDSHQHTHMIPSLFKVLLKVLSDEKIDLKYIRIPAEPLLPFLKTPSLYFTYSGINIIKQWLLNFLWLINKSRSKKTRDTVSLFFRNTFFRENGRKKGK